MSPNLRGFARLVLEKNGQGEEETGGLMGVKGGEPVWSRAVEKRGRVSTHGILRAADGEGKGVKISTAQD